MAQTINSAHSSQARRFGFSLIELLVVVGIIGTLATILLPNLIGVRQRGQDGRRRLDVEQIRSALEQYRSVNGYYPTTTSTLTTPVVYIQTLPTDPLASSGYSYQYLALPSGCNNTTTYCTDYTVAAYISTVPGCQAGSLTGVGYCAPSSGACNYCMGSLGTK